MLSWVHLPLYGAVRDRQLSERLPTLKPQMEEEGFWELQGLMFEHGDRE